jgi:hypothetical protein
MKDKVDIVVRAAKLKALRAFAVVMVYEDEPVEDFHKPTIAKGAIVVQSNGMPCER